MTPPLDALSLLGGVGIGALGSPHCVAMCGGIAGALAMAGPSGCGAPAPLARQAAYNLGRVASYAIAGAVAGALGVALAQLLGPTGTLVLRALAALLLLALGLYLAGWWPGLARLERQGARLWRHIAPLAARLQPGRSLAGTLALGMLWGWLPCGLVYTMNVIREPRSWSPRRFAARLKPAICPPEYSRCCTALVKPWEWRW